LGIRSYLVNEEYQDPLVLLQFDGYRDSILFDLGYMFPLKLRDIQRIDSIFVSHTHFDHFMGFDHFLRLSMEQDRTVELYGPSDFIAQVASKLGGYTWNLCESIKLDFHVFEVGKETIKDAVLMGREAYALRNIRERERSDVIAETDLYVVKTAILNHRIPVLAYSVEERNALKVRKEELDKMGLKPGPWLRDLKEQFPTPVENVEEIFIDGKSYRRAILESQLLELRKGKKISYIVDTIFCEETSRDAVQLVNGSDELYCEMAYLSLDESKALENYHLTASQAAMIARDASVKKLMPLHFSKRYEKRYQELIIEARKVFPHVEKAFRYYDREI